MRTSIFHPDNQHAHRMCAPACVHAHFLSVYCVLVPLQLSSFWSSELSYVLGPALSSYESERVTGVAYGNAEFQQAIQRTVPESCVFKAVPFQFTSLHPAVNFASMLQSRALVDLLTQAGSDLRFGLRVKVVLYPEDFVACWIMLASIKKADDFLQQAQAALS